MAAIKDGGCSSLWSLTSYKVSFRSLGQFQASQATHVVVAWLLQLFRGLPVVHRLVVAGLLQLLIEKSAHRLVVVAGALLPLQEVDTQVAQAADRMRGNHSPGASGKEAAGITEDLEGMGFPGISGIRPPQGAKHHVSDAQMGRRDCGQKPCRLGQNNCLGTLGQDRRRSAACVSES